MNHVTRPWGTRSEEFRIIESMADQLVGRSVQSVYYVLPENASCEESGPQHFDGFDFVSHISMGIELQVSESEVFSVIWMMHGVDPGMLDGLAVGKGRCSDLDSPHHHGRDLTRCDVTDTQAWTTVLGDRIEKVSWAWQSTEVIGYRSVWSLRLEFSDASPLVVALGEVIDASDASIEFSPDHLVVISDMNIAKRYKHLTAETSAYGGDQA